MYREFKREKLRLSSKKLCRNIRIIFLPMLELRLRNAVLRRFQ